MALGRGWIFFSFLKISIHCDFMLELSFRVRLNIKMGDSLMLCSLHNIGGATCKRGFPKDVTFTSCMGFLH